MNYLEDWLQQMRECSAKSDVEMGHKEADDLLVEIARALADDTLDSEQRRVFDEVMATYEGMFKWYA